MVGPIARMLSCMISDTYPRVRHRRQLSLARAYRCQQAPGSRRSLYRHETPTNLLNTCLGNIAFRTCHKRTNSSRVLHTRICSARTQRRPRLLCVSCHCSCPPLSASNLLSCIGDPRRIRHGCSDIRPSMIGEDIRY